MEVTGLAVWAEALTETKLTDEQVPFFYLIFAQALTSAKITIGIYLHHSLSIYPFHPVISAGLMKHNETISFIYGRL